MNTFKHTLVKQARWWQWKAETLEKENEQLKAENAALRERLEKAVELPFRVGQELYMIDDFTHANVWKGICNGIEVKQTRIPQRVLFYVYVAFEDPETCTLRARKFTNETLNEIYTTREVAEARLAELKGERNEDSAGNKRNRRSADGGGDPCGKRVYRAASQSQGKPRKNKHRSYKRGEGGE